MTLKLHSWADTFRSWRDLWLLVKETLGENLIYFGIHLLPADQTGGLLRELCVYLESSLSGGEHVELKTGSFPIQNTPFRVWSDDDFDGCPAEERASRLLLRTAEKQWISSCLRASISLNHDPEHYQENIQIRERCWAEFMEARKTVDELNARAGVNP